MPGYLTVERESFFEASALLKGLAGASLIGPETGVGNQGLQFIELTLAGTGVKETSGRLRCVAAPD